MGSDILRPDSEDAVPSPTQEVEFALVLSRVIDSVRTNPDYLRATIYELARYKLREQCKSESLVDDRKLSKSLEIAIQGVEAFHKKKEAGQSVLPELDVPQQKSLISAHVSHQDVTPVAQPHSPVIEVIASTRERRPHFKAIWGFAAALAIGFAVAFATISLDLLGKLDLLGNKRDIVINRPTPTLPKVDTPASPQPAPTAADTRLAAPAPALPSSFGVYAVSDNKLYELEVLPGRAPDARIAISALITRDSHTTLPDGHLSFIVYRRDSATNAADHAEVRLIARIERETSYKDGKQVVTDVGDNWVIRNISTPYRTAPKNDNPDMYEVRSENPETPLVPGRYALVLKGLAYDFAVAGPVTDPRQCLERLVADNGQFYSECKTQ